MTALVALGFSQEYLYHRQLLHAVTSRPIHCAHSILGDLDIPALRSALNAVVARHEAIRLRIVPTANEPKQFVAAHEPTDEILNCRRLVGLEGRRLEKAITYIAGTGCGLDAISDRSFAFTLIRLSQDHHVLLSSFEQVIMDGHSLKLIEEDIWSQYRLCANGMQPDSRPAEPKFTDVIMRQHRQFRRRRPSSGDYWTAKMTAGPALTQLDRARPDGTGAAGPAGSEAIEITGTALEGIRATCSELGTTTQSWLLCALSRTLFEFTAQDTAVIRVAIDSRSSEDSGVVGRLAGFYPVHIRREVESPARLLGQVQRELFGAMLNQCADGKVRLDAESRRESDQGSSQGHTIVVDYRTLGDSDHELSVSGGLRVERMSNLFADAPPDCLRMLIRERPNMMAIVLNYNSADFAERIPVFLERLRKYATSSSTEMRSADQSIMSDAGGNSC